MYTSNKNKNYLITNTTAGVNFTLTTSIPTAKRAKNLVIKSGKTKLKLNGRQLKALKTVFAKEQKIISTLPKN